MRVWGARKGSNGFYAKGVMARGVEKAGQRSLRKTLRLSSFLTVRDFARHSAVTSHLAQLHVTPCPSSSLGIFWLLGFRFARIALASLNHIALASEPAYILVAGSLYRLGQRLRQESVT